jgi:mRNA interferase MazF
VTAASPDWKGESGAGRRFRAPATFRPEVEIEGLLMRVLVEQLRAVDLDRLDRHVGRLTLGEQREIDAALELVLAL